ncbi:MAG: putative Ig domain-containing protein [Acidobacteria bacterium]|nr:putative Ig domain-containing protein [Acidobacteriota bacterium]
MSNAGLFTRVKFGLFVLSISALALFGRRTSELTATASEQPLPNVQGASATEYLRQQGLYPSLSSALSAARYQAQPLPTANTFQFLNPAQRFRAQFRNGDVRVRATGDAPDSELIIKLTGYGYGGKLISFVPGGIEAHQNRIEYEHHPQLTQSAIGSRQEPEPAIKEWFINSAEGLEHGFVLPAPPAVEHTAITPLRVELALDGDWEPHLDSTQQTVALTTARGAGALSYGQLRVTDANGAAVAAHFELAGRRLSIAMEENAAAYPLTIDPLLMQQTKLTANDGLAGDKLGSSVAISGDTAIIGAPYDDVVATDQGSVYVFVRGLFGWSQQARLNASDGATSDNFGSSLAINGNTAVIGSLGSIGGNSKQGSVYVFVRNGTTWSLQQKLTASDGAANDFFGWSVAIGTNTIVVGAEGDDIGANGDQGSASVFVFNGTAWTQQQKLTASDGKLLSKFGWSVGISGETVIVGAEGDTVGASSAQGSAYVFVRSGTTWTQQQKLTASDGAANDLFAISVAISGDTVIVGANGDDIGANTSQGSAYVFIRGGSVWAQQQKLIAADGAASDFFGISVAISGDTVVIGADFDDTGGNSAQGSVYVFARTGVTWAQQKKLMAPDGATNDFFGQAVAISGDTIVVGASGDDIGASVDQGSASVFVIYSGLAQQQKLTASDGGGGDFFGISVAISGDTVVVGAEGDDVGGNQSQGSAYIFVRNGGTWTQQQKLTASDGAAFDSFGKSVGISGDTVVLGASGDDIGANMDQGSAYVFVRSGGVWTQQQKLTAGDGVERQQFGTSVAISGDTVVIGAYGEIFGNSIGPAAYAFVRSGITWMQQQKLTANDTVGPSKFGASVAISGDTVVVGANGDIIGGNISQGSVYVFVRGGTTWTQQQKLTASDGAAGDQFGVSVGISSDTIVAGAYGKSSYQGAAYVFVPSGATWTQQQKLTANDGAASDLFGIAVAISEDTVLVGADGDTISGITQGSAYVFTRTGTTWMQQQKLIASDGADPDSFGRSVAISGDTALIGAFDDTIGLNGGQGSAYIFVGQRCPTLMFTPTALSNGATGSSYQQFITASGGVGPYQYSFSDGSLPPGLTLSQNGVISGTPTTAGWFNFTVTATTPNLCPGSQSYTVLITTNCPAITVNPATLPAGNSGQPYNQTLTAAGGALPYSFMISAGGLPMGLTLSLGGALTGTPTVSGSFNFTVTATDNNGCRGVHPYTLTINPPCPAITINPVTLSAGNAGQTYNQTFTATGGAQPYSFMISAGALPAGLTLSPGGALTGTPTVSGPFNFTVTATDANGCTGARPYSLTINPPCPAITVNPVTLPDGIVGSAYNQSLTAMGGAAPYSFSVTAGALPTGVTLSSAGLLSGIPTVVIAFGFIITATDANGCTGTRSYTINISGNPGLMFYPLAHPVRLLDTRPGASACFTPNAPIPGATSFTQPARGICDSLTIPANAAAVTGNITTVQSGGGYLTLYPSDVALPFVANSNFAANQILNNVFTVGLGTADGAFKIYVTTDTNVVVDITGYYAPPAVGGLYFHKLPYPVRLLDTRAGQSGCFTPGAPLGAGTDTTQFATGACAGVTIPPTALAVVGNATTVNPGQGFLTLYPSNAVRPTVASSNFAAGQTMNAPLTVGLSASGAFNIYTLATTDLVVDLLGYYSPDAMDINGAGLLFYPLAHPVRLLETRFGATGCYQPNAALSPNQIYTQPARGACGGVTIPANALGIVGNATVVIPLANGYLTFWPSDESQVFVASSNFTAGAIFNRHFIVGLGNGDGAFKILSSAMTDLVIDVSGYFAP